MRIDIWGYPTDLNNFFVFSLFTPESPSNHSPFQRVANFVQSSFGKLINCVVLVHVDDPPFQMQIQIWMHALTLTTLPSTQVQCSRSRLQTQPPLNAYTTPLLPVTWLDILHPQY